VIGPDIYAFQALWRYYRTLPSMNHDLSCVSGDLKLLSNEQVENVGSPLSVFFQ